MSDRIPRFSEKTGQGKGIEDLSILTNADRRFIGQEDPAALKQTSVPVRDEEWTSAHTDALIAEIDAYREEQEDATLPGRHAVQGLVVEPDSEVPKRDREALRDAARKANKFTFRKKQ